MKAKIEAFNTYGFVVDAPVRGLSVAKKLKSLLSEFVPDSGQVKFAYVADDNALRIEYRTEDQQDANSFAARVNNFIWATKV